MASIPALGRDRARPSARPCGWALTRAFFQGRLNIAPQPANHAPSRGR
jgi:hypothetical protein